MLSLAPCSPRGTTLKGWCELETASATPIRHRLICVILGRFQTFDEHWLKLLLPTRLLSSKQTCQSSPAQTWRLFKSFNEILTFPPVALTNLLFQKPRSRVSTGTQEEATAFPISMCASSVITRNILPCAQLHNEAFLLFINSHHHFVTWIRLFQLWLTSQSLFEKKQILGSIPTRCHNFMRSRHFSSRSLQKTRASAKSS